MEKDPTLTESVSLFCNQFLFSYSQSQLEVAQRDSNPGIPDIFLNPEIPGLGGSNPGI
jgi:hypothetical protein